MPNYIEAKGMAKIELRRMYEYARLSQNFENDTKKFKYEDVVMNNVKEYKFPILKCNDFGHNCSNVVIPIGARARLIADKCKVELL